MPDDPCEHNVPYGLRLSLDEDYEVEHWCDSLGCTERDLYEAVLAVGYSALRVRAYLKMKAA